MYAAGHEVQGCPAIACCLKARKVILARVSDLCINSCNLPSAFFFAVAMENGGSSQGDAPADNQLHQLLDQRQEIRSERSKLRQVQKNEKRKRDRIMKKASQLSREDLLALAANAR